MKTFVARPILIGITVLALAACGTEQATPPVGAGASGGASGSAAAQPSGSAGSSGMPQATGSGAAPAGAETPSEITDNAFGPDLNLPPGTTVVWTNAGQNRHTVTHGGAGRPADVPFFDEELAPGATFEFAFEITGAVPITCRIHPTMEMEVIIQPQDG